MNPSVNFLKKDKYFAKLIKKHGPLELSRGGAAFRALAEAIIYQQLSGTAAGTIFRRFVALFGTKPNAKTVGKKTTKSGKINRKFPTPAEVLAMSAAQMRTAGISKQKAGYLRDLALKFHTKTVDHKRFHKMSNAEITEHLLKVKGVGEWTAHMFLMSTLGRPDVLPVGDLGIRKGFQVVYKLRSLPDKKRMEKLAREWRAHATTASRYLWRAADEAKED
jgi:DNA-3-methyladenine glycosylase II